MGQTNRSVTSTAGLQIRSVAKHAQKVHQGKDRDLQWRSGDTQVFHRPAQEMIQVGVGILFTGKAEDEFVEMACGNIAAMVPPQGKMSLEQFCILEKIEAGVV